jgi:hypothetical protein
VRDSGAALLAGKRLVNRRSKGPVNALDALGVGGATAHVGTLRRHVRVWLLTLSFAPILAACGGPSPAPVAIKTCDAIDENNGRPSGPSRVHLVVRNASNATVKSLSVFVSYGSGAGDGYGLAIQTNQPLQPHRSMQLAASP